MGKFDYLLDSLEKARHEEVLSEATYMALADGAQDAGLHKAATALRSIVKDEKRHADQLRELIAEIRATEGEEGERHYWEVTNMVTGEILQLGTEFTSIAEATKHAKKFLKKDYQHYGGDHLVIKIFSQSPDERAGLTLTPEHTESFWVSEDEIKLSGKMIEIPIEQKREPTRLFPRTYNDWVSLGMDIKEKVGINDYETVSSVNFHLNRIYEEEQYPEAAQEAKRWLTEKAGELGV